MDVCGLRAEDPLASPELEVEETLEGSLSGVALPGAHVQVVVLVGVARGKVLPKEEVSADVLNMLKVSSELF